MIIKESFRDGLVGIWWYTDDNRIWSFTKTLDDAIDDYGYLQYYKTLNHMNLWKRAVEQFVTNKQERDKLFNKGFKSLERGRVVYNIRTQCYEVICSNALVNDEKFRKICKDYFNLNGCRVSFEALNHYCKLELTGNPSIDKFYFDN